MFEKITNHAALAAARFTEKLKNAPRALAILEAASMRTQSLENVLFSLFEDRTVDSAEGSHLDAIGAIVNQPRLDADDDLYRLRIKARIRTNRSRGTTNDILGVFRALFPEATLEIKQEPPASLTVKVLDLVLDDDPRDLALAFLREAVAAGVGASLLSSKAPKDETFTLPGTAILAADADPPGPGTHSIRVVSTKNLPDSGELWLSFDTPDQERVAYASKTLTTLEGLAPWSNSHAADSLAVQVFENDKALASTFAPTIGGHLATIRKA